MPSSELFNEVTELSRDIADFATGLAAKLKDTIERLPNSTVLVDMARQMAENWLNDKLCLVPPSGSGINSGNQMVVIGPADKNPALADSDDLFVGASRLNIATHIATLFRCSYSYCSHIQVLDHGGMCMWHVHVNRALHVHVNLHVHAHVMCR